MLTTQICLFGVLFAAAQAILLNPMLRDVVNYDQPTVSPLRQDWTKFMDCEMAALGCSRFLNLDDLSPQGSGDSFHFVVGDQLTIDCSILEQARQCIQVPECDTHRRIFEGIIESMQDVCDNREEIVRNVDCYENTDIVYSGIGGCHRSVLWNQTYSMQQICQTFPKCVRDYIGGLCTKAQGDFVYSIMKKGTDIAFGANCENIPLFLTDIENA